MKKLIATITIFSFLIFQANTYAQRKMPRFHHEIRAQISDGSSIAIVTGFFNTFSNVFDSFGEYDKISTNTTSFGHLNLGYRYHFSKKFNIGIDLGYQRIAEDYTLKPKEGNLPIKKGKYITSAILIMPTVELIYMNKPIVRLYGNLDFGIGIFTHKEYLLHSNEGRSQSVTVLPAFQINPFGIRVGKKVAGYLELGFGYQGFITAGLSIGF